MTLESLKYKLYVFDLDDTLYRETDYLFASYKEIATSEADGDESRAEIYYRFLCDTFVREGRARLFQKFKLHFGIETDVQTMVEQLHHTICPLEFFEPMRNLITDLLRQGKQVAILTNGDNEQQSQKVHNLRMAAIFPMVKVIYATQIESKPSPKALLYLMQSCGASAKETLMIGDSEIDKMTAENAGVDYINTK